MTRDDLDQIAPPLTRIFNRHLPTPTPLLHRTTIAAGAAVIGLFALFDSTVIAALLAGAFTTANTMLTVYLTRDQRPRGRRRRRRRREDDE